MAIDIKLGRRDERRHIADQLEVAVGSAQPVSVPVTVASLYPVEQHVAAGDRCRAGYFDIHAVGKVGTVQLQHGRGVVTRLRADVEALVADIQPADIDLRRKILEHRLTRFASNDVPDDVIEFLARTISRNVRELVGGLNKLIAYAQLTGQPVSLNLAEEQLTDILSANRRRITIDEIQRTVCQFYRLDRSEMASKRRARAVVRPRQVAMYLAKVLTPRSYPEIGRKFGGRDHSTVIHAVRLIEDLRTRDADMDGDVRSLLRQLES